MKIRTRVLALAVAAVVACGGSGTDESTANGGGRAVESASAANSEAVALTVPSMSCPLCSRSIEVRLKEAGVRDVRVDLEAKRVTVVFDPSRTTAAEVRALVEGQGFPVTESRRVDAADVETKP